MWTAKSLWDRCQHGPIPLEEAVNLTCQLCDGLTRAHELGIVHRDLEPANVLLTKDGVPKITDFGLARMETGDTGQTMSGAILGTLDFMPPEQRRDATKADARSDLWSLAATLYQMVTGKSPKVIRLNEVPHALQSALGKALEDKPENRFRSAVEFKQHFRQALEESRSTLTHLGEGQCPSCGTKNEPQRKFCRQCATSLEVKCLSCSKSMPVWDEICGSCGTKQSPLISSRKEQMQERQQQAEAALREGRFAQATNIAGGLQVETDLRFQHLRKWAADFSEEIEKERRQQQQRAEVLISEAKTHQAAHDYASAIHALEQIPASLRAAEITALLNHLQSQEQRAKSLYEKVRLRVERRELQGLIPEVDELLQLLPDRVDLRDLRDTLEKREQQRLAAQISATAEARQLLDVRKYAECVAVLQRIEGNLRTPDIEALQKEAATKLARFEQLQKHIEQSVKQNQLQGLLANVEEYLALKSNVTDSDRKLREQLVAREQKQKSQIKALLQKVRQLRKDGQFDEALELLRRVPAELRNDDITTAVEDLQFFKEQRSGAIEQLKQAQNSQQIEQALKLADEYRSIVTSSIISDSTFESAMKESQQRLDHLRQEEARTAQRRQQRRKVILIGSVLSLLLVAAVTFFVVQRQQRLTAIADAQKRGDAALQAIDYSAAVEAYDEVIGLDNKVGEAWLGRALAKLQQTPPDVTGAWSDLEKGKVLTPDASQISKARQLAHVQRAIERANADSITEALEDIAAAEKLSATAEEILSAKGAVASAYLRQAESAVAAKQLDAAVTHLKEAETTNPSVDQFSTVNRLVANAFLDRAAESLKQSMAEPAIADAEAARQLQADLPRISQLHAAGLVISAQQALEAGNRDQASADFLKARNIDASAAGLGTLASTFAEGLVKRCEDSFSDAAFQEATAGLQTAEEIDASSVSLPALKERLGNVLAAEGDKALQAKETDRMAGILQTLIALEIEPESQSRLSNAIAAEYFEICQQQIAAQDLTSAVASLERLQLLAEADTVKKDQAVAGLLPGISLLLLKELEGNDPAAAVRALKSISSWTTFTPEFTDELRKRLNLLTADLKSELPKEMIAPPTTVAPFDAAQAQAHQTAWADYLGVPVETTNSIGMKLVVIPPGEFMMGSPEDEADRSVNEGPQHKVRITKPFYMGVTEVTQGQWVSVMGTKPWAGKEYVEEGNDNPVVYVSWRTPLRIAKS